MNTINKDTKIYGSFSNNPGNNGCYFFNSKFKEDNINAIYKSFYSINIDETIRAVKHLNFSGFALSMPLKVEVLKHLDIIDSPAYKIQAVNTVINFNDKLYGYNTDWVGVYNYFLDKNLKHVNIIGNGGFGKAIAYAFAKLNITFSVILRQDIPNIDDASNEYFINATPTEIISEKNTIIDARPFTEEGKKISLLQAEEQYKIYKRWMNQNIL